ncbi:MAG: hypothetical protein E7607_07910 [Ruminococcaceae bacterium]|nr:hypothetical protein [Oscillospiraceae bacterium]
MPIKGDPEITEIRVIVDRDASLELIGAAERLCKTLSDTLHKSAYVSYEGDVTSGGGAKEIWLGYGSTVAARGIMRDLRADDFLCREIGNVIVMGGKSHKATLNAIERYCNEILPSATKYKLIPENGGFEYVGDYPIESAVINGVSVNGFEIVIKDKDNSELLWSALQLQGKIAEKVGYWLDIVEENERIFESKGIFLNSKKQEAEGIARIIPTHTGFELTAEGYVGLIKCVDKFIGLFDSESGTSSLNIEVNNELRIEYSPVNFRVASMRLDAYAPLDTPSAFEAVMAEAMKSCPELLLTGKTSAKDGELILKNLSGYSAVRDKSGEIYGYSKNIFCRLDEVTETDGVRIEYYTVEKEGIDFTFVKISGSPADCSGHLDISDRVPDSGLPVTVLAQTVGMSVSEILPSYFVNRCSDSYYLRDEENFFDCFTVGNRFSAELSSKKDSETTYREITVSINK